MKQTKKDIWKISLMLSLIITCSCEKESAPETLPSSETGSGNQNISPIEQKDGMLYFQNQSDFYNAQNMFCSMSKSDRINWSKSNNFKTQQILLDEVSIAQESFEKSFYAGIPEGLTIEELQARGLQPAFCTEYTKQLQKGLFVEKIEEDGSISIRLNQSNPSVGYVVNENGFVLVEDMIYFYDNVTFKMKKYQSAADIEILKRTDDSNESESIYVFNIGDDRSTCHQFYLDNIWGNHGTLANPTWYYDASDLRFKHFVDFSSCISESLTSMNSYFYTEARAEKRLFWVWDTRNNYNPIDYINANWSYFWVRLNWNTSMSQYFYNNLSGGNGSPFMLNPAGTTNLLGANLNPSGNYFLSLPYAFDVPVFIQTGGLMHGYFIGNTGNYNTNYDLQ